MSSNADPALLSVVDARDAIRAGTLSPVALVDACLARIEALEPRVAAWVHVDAAGARTQAAQREEEAKSGKIRGVLHGIPVGIKDIFDVEGMPTTCGARSWAHTRPLRDATAVHWLREAGAIILGKTHTTEFAYRDPAPTRNPWNVEHTPGGSSSGSAAAVAARMVPLALGTQTVGSVLRPAAYCGVVGYKGTHGAIPTDGVAALAWSLDHVGVFARSVADVGVALSRMGGASDVDVRRSARATSSGDTARRAEPEVAAQVQAAARAFAAAGAGVEEVKLPASFAEIHEAGQLILEAEAAAYHEASFRAHGADYGPGLKKLVEEGLTRPATPYVRALRTRQRFRDEASQLLAGYDALVCPTAPAPAPAGLAWTGDASHCAPWSTAGFPAISLPSGVAASGLPLAIQLVASPERHGILLYLSLIHI